FVAAVVLIRVKSVFAAVSVIRTDFNFKLPVKSPAVPLPMAKDAAPRRDKPVSEFQSSTCPLGIVMLPPDVIVAALPANVLEPLLYWMPPEEPPGGVTTSTFRLPSVWMRTLEELFVPCGQTTVRPPDAPVLVELLTPTVIVYAPVVLLEIMYWLLCDRNEP